MSLIPTLAETISRARADLRVGLPVGFGGWLGASVETLSPARLADLRALGPVVLAVTGRRAETLKARAYDGDLARVRVPAEADVAWLRAVADPADDLRMPMKGPLFTDRDGDTTPHRAALALAKSAELLPAMVMVEDAAPEGLTRLPPGPTLAQLAAETVLAPVASARLPLAAAERSRLHVLRPDDGGIEHYAVEIGAPRRDLPVLARNDANAAVLTSMAFSTGLPGNWGQYIVALGVVMFASSTILGWSYYGDRCVERLFGARATLAYRIVFTLVVYVGATIPLGIVWSFADVMNGLMALPNLIGLLILSGLIARETAHYLKNDPKLRAGRTEVDDFMADQVREA